MTATTLSRGDKGLVRNAAREQVVNKEEGLGVRTTVRHLFHLDSAALNVNAMSLRVIRGRSRVQIGIKDSPISRCEARTSATVDHWIHTYTHTSNTKFCGAIT